MNKYTPTNLTTEIKKNKVPKNDNLWLKQDETENMDSPIK